MKLHQILITENKQLPQSLPPLTEYCYENVRRLYNDWDYHLYSGEEIEEIIKNNFDKDVFTAYNKLKPFSYKSDLARACLLHLYGGLYIDLHIFFISIMDKSNLEQCDFCAFRDLSFFNVYNFAIQTGIIFAKPKSLVIEKFLEKIILNCKEEYHGFSSLSPTGPYCLGKGFYSTIKNENKNNMMIGELRRLTSKNLGFVDNDDNLIALRMKENDNLIKTGLQGINNYVEMWHKRDIYNENVKF